MASNNLRTMSSNQAVNKAEDSGKYENNQTPWQIPEGHYDYNCMKVLLVEGKGGAIAPYEDVLKRVGITGRPEV